MIRIAIVLALLLILAVLALPASASTSPPGPDAGVSVHAQEEEDEGGSSFADVPGGLNAMVVWSIVGLGIVAAVLGFFYFMKRQVGGFPENPSWVAPITIMPSKDFPDEGDFGDEPTAPAHH